ncbi:MAG: c-type cytochrome [Pseudomonadota bacterium]
MRISLFLCALLATVPAQAAQDAPLATGKMLGNTCAACHGTFGKSHDEYMPSLAGIDRQQLIRAMTDYREDRRMSVVMNRIAKGYTDAEIAAIADYFSKIK